MRTTSSLLLLSLLGLLGTACGGTYEDGDWNESEEDVGEAADEIINGTVMAAANSGIVMITNTAGGVCSGTLLTNRWILSAAHCFDPADLTTPVGVRLDMGGPVRFAKEIILQHGHDVALVRIDGTMPMNNSSSGFEANLHRGPIDGTTVRCMGYGRNTFNGGTGTLRFGDVTVSGSNGFDTFSVIPNAAGQVPWRGDSGGPCWVTLPNGRSLAGGVGSFATFLGTQVLSADYVSSFHFRGWVAETRTSKELVARHSNKCVEANDIGTANGLIEQRSCDGGADQRWRYEYAGVSWLGELWRVRDTDSGKCLTVPSGQSGNGVGMLLSPCGSGDNQRWVFEDMGSGFRRVRNLMSLKCLDVPSSSQNEGVGLIQSQCHAGNNQQFSPRTHVDGGAFELSSLATGKCLDVPNASQASNVLIQQSQCNLGSNQAFRLEEVASGIFRIHPQHSNLCFDIPDGSTADQAQIQQYTCHNGDNQRWRLLHQHGGFYAIQSVSSGKCLDIPGSSPNNGAILQQYGCHGGANQTFEIKM